MRLLQKVDSNLLKIARSDVGVYGFCALQGALTPTGCAALEQEALIQFENCCFSHNRSGVAYEAYLADLGPIAASYLRSRATATLLRRIFDQRYSLVPEKSCFTYYFSEGHLAPHLDNIPGQRAVSVLTYLLVDADGGTDGPALDVYGRNEGKPGERRLRIRTTVATIVLGYGASVWHGRAPLRSDEKIIMINGSYSAEET